MKTTLLNYYGTKVLFEYNSFLDNEGSFCVELINVFAGDVNINVLLSEAIFDELQQMIFENIN